MDDILRLYPAPTVEIPLAGAYLAHDLNAQSRKMKDPLVYANFVASLDGRIAIPAASGQGLMIPKVTANPRDWRLYQELAAQADIILSSGRYLRDWAEGRAQEILQVDDPRFADLRAWRKSHGLPPQADIVIISASLDFPIPPVLTAAGRRVLVFTTENPDVERVKEIEAQAGQVIVAGKGSVDGALMMDYLAEFGYHSVYSAAGPQVLHLLVTGNVLGRLYLTLANRLLGGKPFATLLEGPLLAAPLGLKISHIYLDPHALDGFGQLFITYARA
jgi:riboflavin biosynthesis pyrimidine reductase